ncbi:hypothetical protein [Serratia ureilytica]|uniref:hypothetical protein n=1 Tax=Serratia ureilytica TaxID=300181 RepID=UPI003F7E9B8F
MDTDKNLREEHLKLSEEISKLNIEMQRKKTKLSELVATEENIEKQNKTIMDMSMKIGMLEPSALQSELTIKNLIQSQKEMDKKIAEIQEIINNRELEKDEMRVSVSEIIHDINMIIRIYI